MMDRQFQFEKMLWLGAAMGAVIFFALLLAVDNILLTLASGAFLWMATIPYHARLSVMISAVTFNSALAIPIAGQPLVWEVASVMGWSGMIVLLFLRQYSPDFREQLHQRRFILLGAVGYVLVLLVMMRLRGVGLLVFGSENVGGRVYLQQLSCAIFPVLFLAVPIGAKLLKRLFVLQCLLSITFLISDLVLATGSSGPLWMVLNFLTLSNDSLFFESQSQFQGLRRFQSFAIVAQAGCFLILTRYGLNELFSGRRPLMLLLLAALGVVGLIGGHRALLVILTLTVLLMAWGERFYSPGRVAFGGVFATLLLVGAYTFGESLPLAAQRSLSILPGMRTAAIAADDAQSTFDGRLLMRRVGWEVAPNYLLLGRGFGMNPNVVESPEFDPFETIKAHLQVGRFYNGFIGLLVNTGLPGLLFMSMFLFGISRIAWKLLVHLRVHGCDDTLGRLCALLAANWLANVVFFYVAHGDSEFAMRTFGLQSGLLMVASKLRIQQFEAEAA